MTLRITSRSVNLAVAGVSIALAAAFVVAGRGDASVTAATVPVTNGMAGHDMSGMVGTDMAPGPVERRAGTAVSVVDFGFSPSTLTTSLGATVTWTFRDAATHTATATQGAFFDSGDRSADQTFAHAFTSAGTFAYDCGIHTSMTGRVVVPVRATGSPPRGYTVTWATTRPAGTTYDVQVRRPGSTRWVALRTATTAGSARFAPPAAGTYALRALTDLRGQRSGWSPTLALRIS